METKGLGWKIFGLLVSIFLIWGGLSGEMVLRGTNSSAALVVVGFLFLIWDIYAIATHKKQQVEQEGVNPEPLPDSLPLQPGVHYGNNIVQEGMNHHVDAPKASLLPPAKYSGIQWFFKVLSHYAEFSGRARRQEYWMFALFNVIFAFVLTFIITYIAIINSYDPTLASTFAYYSYLIAVMLPGLAVAVRRLHDTGKSGWMMLVSLIPIVGGIWLFVLMVTDSQPEENEYGPNPKLYSEALDDMKRLKIAGVTLIVAASMGILARMVLSILYVINLDYFNYWNILGLIVHILLLTAGIYLLKEKQLIGMLGKGKSMMIMLVAVSLSVLFGLWGSINSILHIQLFGWQIAANELIYLTMFLSFALFSAAVLFTPQNKNLIRKAAVTVIVLAGFLLLWQVYFIINRIGYTNNDWQIAERLLNLFYNLLPVAFIVLAGTYLSGKHQPVVYAAQAKQYGRESAPAHGKETVAYDTVNPSFVLEHKIGSKYHRAGENQTITANRIEIGRDPDCEVRYDEFFETVSRRHAAIVREGNAWKLVSLSQTNSTLVNGQKIQQAWYLQHGDEIQCAVNGPKLGFQMPALRDF